MKQRYVVLLCCLLLSGISGVQAQLQKGNLMVGGELTNLKLDFQEGNTTFGLALTPRLGYFIEDNIALGGYLRIGLQTSDGYTDFTYSVGPFGRYYFSDKKLQLLKQSRFFLEGNVGFEGRNYDLKNGPSTSTNGLGIGFGPGLAYFLNQNIALEALLKYNLTVGFGSSTTNNQIGLGLGFQIYMPTRRARAIYNDARDEMRKK